LRVPFLHSLRSGFKQENRIKPLGIRRKGRFLYGNKKRFQSAPTGGRKYPPPIGGRPRRRVSIKYYRKEWLKCQPYELPH